MFRYIGMILCWMWNFSCLLLLQSNLPSTSLERLSSLVTSPPSCRGMKQIQMTYPSISCLMLWFFFSITFPLFSDAGMIVVSVGHSLLYNPQWRYITCFYCCLVALSTYSNYVMLIYRIQQILIWEQRNSSRCSRVNFMRWQMKNSRWDQLGSILNSSLLGLTTSFMLL